VEVAFLSKIVQRRELYSFNNMQGEKKWKGKKDIYVVLPGLLSVVGFFLAGLAGRIVLYLKIKLGRWSFNTNNRSTPLQRMREMILILRTSILGESDLPANFSPFFPSLFDLF